MTLRVLVTGSSGQLGGEIASWRGAGAAIIATNREGCDVLNPSSIAAALQRYRPEAVINCAAWTRVDAAEKEPEAAHALNAIAPANLAEACAARDVLLLHVSTDYVFAGDGETPLAEDAPAAPQTVYGRTKLAGEAAVRAITPRHQIVRTSWLYGRNGPNFALSILRRAAAGEQLRVVADQTGTPTWTGHLVRPLLRLVELGVPGTYHLSNSGSTTWHGFALELLHHAGVHATVQAIRTEEYASATPRPRYTVLDNAAWHSLGEPPLPSWQDGAAAYIAELRGRGALPATPVRP